MLADKPPWAIALMGLVGVVLAYWAGSSWGGAHTTTGKSPNISPFQNDQPSSTSGQQDGDQASRRATLAGGCFWCMEPPYDTLPGVQKTVVGYTGGEVADPSYQQVAAGNTGHREAIQIFYDSAQITYRTLLQVFWRNIAPFDERGQFCDRGFQYTSAIFYHDSTQQQQARQTR